MRILLLIPVLLLFACGDSSKNDELESKSKNNANTGDETNGIIEQSQRPCKSKEAFVPEGWEIIKIAKGDLNKDKIEDVAFVMMDTDPKNLISDEYNKIDGNPRELVILFGSGKANCYYLNMKSSTFILSYNDLQMDDPFEDVEISNGTMKLNFRSWYNMGSWLSSTYTYVWRFQDGEFKLIGANSSQFHRSSGEAVDISVNFSTNKYSYTTSNMFDDDLQEQTLWKTLKLKELKTFKTFSKPWTWTVNDEVYL